MDFEDVLPSGKEPKPESEEEEKQYLVIIRTEGRRTRRLMTADQIDKLLDAVEKNRRFFMWKNNHFIHTDRIEAIKVLDADGDGEADFDLYEVAGRKRPKYYKL